VTVATNIQIRQAGAADVETIASFQCRLADESENITLDIETVRKGVRAVVNDPNKGLYWLAEVEGRCVACTMILYEWSDWRNGIVWWIHSLYVLPEFRRRGVLKALYGHLRSLVEADESLRGLRLYVEKDNRTAMAAYEALGMYGQHYKLYEWMVR
jgi:ribosomal protein S18 acetylase RimI-like enzyme